MVTVYSICNSISMTNTLYIPISTFQSILAVPSTAVFCSALVSCFPDMMFRYFLNDFDMVQLSLLLLVSLLFLYSIYVVLLLLRSLGPKSFLTSLLITFLYPEIEALHFHYHRLQPPVYFLGCFVAAV